MSSQPELFDQATTKPDLIDRIASALPESLRTDYYRELSHCRTLPENDEMLRILRAMQFLTVLIERAPGQVALEREQLAQILGRAVESMQAVHRDTMGYQKQLEARLTKLPQEIATKFDAEAIAAKLSESIRQQFQETGLPAIADTISGQTIAIRNTSKALAGVIGEFAHSKNGAVPQVNEALSGMKADLKNAADHVRAQMNGLGKELWRSISVLCCGTFVVGILVGMLYYRWIEPPVQPPQAATQTIQPMPQPIPANPARPHHKEQAQ